MLRLLMDTVFNSTLVQEMSVVMGNL